MKLENTEQIAKKLGKQARAIDAPSPLTRLLRKLAGKKFSRKNSGRR